MSSEEAVSFENVHMSGSDIALEPPSAIETLVNRLASDFEQPPRSKRWRAGVGCADCEDVDRRLRRAGITAVGFCYYCAKIIYGLPHGLAAYGL